RRGGASGRGGAQPEPAPGGQGTAGGGAPAAVARGAATGGAAQPGPRLGRRGRRAGRQPRRAAQETDPCPGARRGPAGTGPARGRGRGRVMSNAHPPRTGGNAVASGATDRSITDLLVEQRHCWQRGERALVETFLQRQPALTANFDAVLDLI